MASDAEIELERLKVAIEEKRLAAELTRAVIGKHKEWQAEVTYEYSADEAGKAFATILRYIREEK